MLPNGWAMVSLWNCPLGHSERTKPSLQDKNFHLGNSAAMNYSRCWQTLFD